MRRTGSLTAVTITAVLATGSVVAGTVAADAATRPASRITVSASDTTPQSGEQVVLRGRLTTATGAALAGGLVKVQTLRGDSWVDLAGARVTTGERGYYRVRIVLSQRGERDLRVVGDPAGTTLRSSRARLDVTVG